MKDTQFNIFFKSEQPSSHIANPADPGGNLNPKEPDKPDKNSPFGLAGAFAYDAVKTGIQLGMSRVGEYKRNQVLQNRINAAQRSMKYVSTFAINPYLGMFTMGMDVLNGYITVRHNEEIENNTLSILNKRYSGINRSRR